MGSSPSSGAGSARVAQARITSATGRAPVTTCPVSSVSPVRHRVAQPELDRIDAARLGQLVHLGLVGEAHLHCAEAPHGAARRVVGAHAEGVDRCVLHLVGAAAEAGRVGHDVVAGGPVGAAVEHDPALEAHEGAVGLGRVAHPDAAGVAVHVPEEGLLSGVHDLDGTAGTEGEQAGVDVEAHVLPGAERAAHPAEGQPHQVGREAEALRHLVAVVVEPLGRHDEVDAAVLGRDARAPPRDP